jgi:hypothetical protein
MFLREKVEGAGELTLFYDQTAGQEMRQIFEEYVRVHLLRRALPETISERRFVVCSGCGEVIPKRQIALRIERGHTWIRCGVCDTQISLVEQREEVSQTVPSHVPEMDNAAKAGRDSDTRYSILQGKRATDDFDVFLCHTRADRTFVRQLAEGLEEKGVLSCLYDETSWNDIRTQLRIILTELFPTVESTYRIVDDASIPRDKISFTSRAIDNWHTILTEANKLNKVERVIEVAQQDYPEKQALSRVRKHLLQSAKAVVILIGNNSTPLWTQSDIEEPLRMLIQDNRPITVAMLPSAPDDRAIPSFLSAEKGVGLSDKSPEAVIQLFWIVMASEVG